MNLHVFVRHKARYTLHIALSSDSSDSLVPSASSSCGPIVYRLGQRVFNPLSGVRLSVGLPICTKKICYYWLMKKLLLILGILSLAACSTNIPVKEDSISTSSASSIQKAPFVYQETNQKIICHKANPERANEMKELVKSVDNYPITDVYVGSECVFPDGVVALTAVLWATHDNDFSVDLGLYFIQGKEVQNMGGKFETHAGDFGVCDLLMVDDGYIFSHCDSSEGGGTDVEYNAFRISDGTTRTLVKISGNATINWDTAITKDPLLCGEGAFPCDALLTLAPPRK